MLLFVSLAIATDLYIKYSIITVSFISFFLVFFVFQIQEYIDRTLSYRISHIAIITVGLASIWLLRVGPNTRVFQIIVSILISTVVLIVGHTISKSVTRYAINKESTRHMLVGSMLEEVNILTAVISILAALVQLYTEVVRV